MVYCWVSLVNEKLRNKKCENRKILRIFKNDENYFYGDNEFDIFLTPKKDYADLSSVVEKVKKRCGGWVKNIKISDGIDSEEKTLSQLVSHFGFISESGIRKMFPRKESGKIINCIEYRKDGNFYAYGCETEKFYYVFCFATS